MAASPSSSHLLRTLLAGVIVASTGCAMSGGTSTEAPRASDADSVRPSSPAFDQFSPEERDRILAVQPIVTAAADEHGVDPELLYAIIWVESRFNPRAKSSAGARGLMQLMPATAAYLAKRLGVQAARAYDPEFNVRAGALYLSEMITKFGDEGHAVAAYHAGPGNVKRWVEDGADFPDYSQTYVAKVMSARERFVGVQDAPASTKGQTHGRTSAAAAHPADANDEPEFVPDPDSLPDAADIHGVPRELDYDPYAEPQERTAKPKPTPRPKPTPEPSPEPESHEPVFEPHPELDKRERSAPAGWRGRPAPRERPKSKPKPEPKPEPAPKPDASEDAGLGVLPDL